MLAVRDQRSTVNLPADPDSEDGDRLVAGKADDRGGGDRGGISHRLRVQQAADCLVTSDRGAKENEGDDDHSREILGTTVAIGKAPGRRPAGQQDSQTTSPCKSAVTESPTKDHLTAQRPRSVAAMLGSTMP
jgi:hypothetical protein